MRDGNAKGGLGVREKRWLSKELGNWHSGQKLGSLESSSLFK